MFPNSRGHGYPDSQGRRPSSPGDFLPLWALELDPWDFSWEMLQEIIVIVYVCVFSIYRRCVPLKPFKTSIYRGLEIQVSRHLRLDWQEESTVNPKEKRKEKNPESCRRVLGIQKSLFSNEKRQKQRKNHAEVESSTVRCSTSS